MSKMNRGERYSPAAVLSFALIASFLSLLLPPLLKAQTAGPAQPEFSNFEPVSTSNMVNPFDGSFTYNIPVVTIPGPQGSGYALSLSYHSGNTPETQSSWVGYGWTLNPGSVIRDLRGFPDDHKGAAVRYWNKTGKNWTVSVMPKLTFELFSAEELPEGMYGPEELKRMGDLFSFNNTLRYNNRKGFGYSKSINVSPNLKGMPDWSKGVVSLNLSLDDGVGSFNFGINPAKSLIQHALGTSFPSSTEDIYIDTRKNFNSANSIKLFDLMSVFSFSGSMRASNLPEYEGESYNVRVNGMFTTTPMPVGMKMGIEGSYTWQRNRESNIDGAYGYMYSGDAGEGGAMDYYLERESPYVKRENYLAIPFSNADNFTVTGEGVGGGFRLHSDRAGHFGPVGRHSSIEILQAGLELHAGLNVGVGFSLGVGQHTLEVNRWEDESNSAHHYRANKGDDSYFFRFNNDPGGDVTFADDDTPVRARAVGPFLNPPMFKSYDPKISAFISPTPLDGTQRSNYIAYHTNREMMQRSDTRVGEAWEVNGVYYNSYNKNIASRDFVDRSEQPDGIGEIAVFNEHGNRYVYGLPVYSRKEKNLQFGLDGASADDRENNHIAYTVTTPSASELVVGEERNMPYASMFLLTEITTPDYVDLTNNGPTPDDFGGYTKFNYRRAAGSNSKIDGESEGWGENANEWYKWRFPFSGLIYNRNSLSDPEDDRGSLTSGEKELYYLESIETKTHIARFITNKWPDNLGERLDAYEAHHDEAVAMGDRDAEIGPVGDEPPVNKSEYLTRIELHAKKSNGAPGELLQRVNLEYDYSICPGLPGSYKPEGAEKSGGKLTLRKLWFDHGNTANAEISPYVFHYNYRKSEDYAQEVRDAYPEITSFGDAYYPSSMTTEQQEKIQNPDYSQFLSDRWGYYQFNGADRYRIMNPWVDQTPEPEFDPAAWELKVIRLPSDGEIHVQYEQDDYAYVQDQPAMAMVSLLHPASNRLRDGAEGTGVNQARYDINLADLGIQSDPTKPDYSADEIVELQKRIFEQFVVRKEKIYFKYLYALVELYDDFINAGFPVNPEDFATASDEVKEMILRRCGAEYLNGYAQVRDVLLDPPLSPQPTGIKILLGTGEDGDYSIPHELCLDFLRKERAGRVIPGADCDAPNDYTISDDGEAVSSVRQLWSFMGTMFSDLETNCRTLDYPHSYLRIPITRPKKGGGIRVKRLLTYDPGIESGDAALYGQEFFYRTEDGKSSGVAENEPTTGRDENSIVKEMKPRHDEDEEAEIVAGEDLAEYEGPLGASIMPGPSVGYSRVVAHDINTRKTGTGFTVHDFFTAKDYPFGMRYVPATEGTPEPAGLDKNPVSTELEDHADWMILPLGFAGYSKANVWLTQGYSFVANRMHGQPKRTAAYGGLYDPVDPDPASWVLSSLDQYEYFAPGEPVPLMRSASDIGKREGGMADPVVPGGVIEEFETGYPGKEMEVLFEGRWIADDKTDIAVPSDISIPIPVGIPPIVSSVALFSYSTNNLRTHVTTKVARYPALVKRMITYRDGIYDRVDNLAFDPETGRPAVTRTYDEYDPMHEPVRAPHLYDGRYRTYTLPAMRDHREMGQKALGERGTILSGDDISVTRKYLGTDLTPYLSFSFTKPGTAELMEKIVPGDLIRLSRDNGGFAGLYYAGTPRGNMLPLLPTYLGGDIFTSEKVGIEILRSGRTNQLSAASAEIRTFGRPRAVQIADENGQYASNRDDMFLAREGVVTALNTALDLLETMPVTSTTGVSFADDIGIVDVDGTCRTRPSGTPWIELKKGAGLGTGVNISMEVETRTAAEAPPLVSPSYPEDSHPLVVDLNAMLNRTWGMEIQSLTASPSALFDCSSICTPYYDEEIHEGFPRYIEQTFPSAMKTPILAVAGISAIRTSMYDVASGSVSGSDLLVTTDSDIGTGCISDREERTSKLKNIAIVVKQPGTPNALTLTLDGNIRDYVRDVTWVYENGQYDPAQTAKAGYSLACTAPADLGNWVLADEGGNPEWTNSALEPSPDPMACSKQYTADDPGLTPHQDAEKNNSDIVSFYDPGVIFTEQFARFGNDAEGNLTLTLLDENGCDYRKLTTGIKLFAPPEQEETCSIVLAELPGTALDYGAFELDPVTWEVLYRPEGEAAATKIPCLPFCETVRSVRTLNGVVAASAQTFGDDWAFDHGEFKGIPFRANAYESGERGKWRPEGGHVFNTEIYGGTGLFGKSYERSFRGTDPSGPPTQETHGAGVYTGFTLHNPVDEANNSPKWLRTTGVVSYSPHGMPTEQQDVLNIPSASKYGHKNMVPVLIANNAPYDAVAFESFEGASGQPSGVAHSGSNSLMMTTWGGPVSILGPTISRLTWTADMASQGVSVRVWSKSSYTDETKRDELVGAPLFNVTLMDEDDQPLLSIAPSAFKLIAQTGEWSLHEMKTTGLSLSVGDRFGLQFSLGQRGVSGGGLEPNTTWVDDIRVQPVTAQMNCYVYDPASLRLVTTFDDQHFGIYHQYNAEGKLVRTLRETERGMKTVKEQQYHTPTLARDIDPAVAGIPPAERISGDAERLLGRLRGAPARVDMGDNGAGATADILDIELSPEKRTVKLFGETNPTLPDFTEITAPAISLPDVDLLESLEGLDLTEVEKLKFIGELRALDEKLREIAGRDTVALSDDEKRKLDDEVKTLEGRRNEILRDSLKLSDDQIRELYRDAEALRKEKEENDDERK